MTTDFASAMAELRRSANRLAELVVWKELDEEYARPHLPPAFCINHHFNEDARYLYGLFLQRDQSFRMWLSQPDPASDPADISRWRRRLLEVEDRVRRLHITERFKNF
jgi:hypothetical protein